MQELVCEEQLIRAFRSVVYEYEPGTHDSDYHVLHLSYSSSPTGQHHRGARGLGTLLALNWNKYSTFTQSCALTGI